MQPNWEKSFINSSRLHQNELAKSWLRFHELGEKKEQTVNRTTFTNLLFEACPGRTNEGCPMNHSTASWYATLSVQQGQSPEVFSQHHIQRKLANGSHSCCIHCTYCPWKGDVYFGASGKSSEKKNGSSLFHSDVLLIENDVYSTCEITHC